MVRAAIVFLRASGCPVGEGYVEGRGDERTRQNFVNGGRRSF